jgi:hypothetical protein
LEAAFLVQGEAEVEVKVGVVLEVVPLRFQ